MIKNNYPVPCKKFRPHCASRGELKNYLVSIEILERHSNTFLPGTVGWGCKAAKCRLEENTCCPGAKFKVSK